MYYAYLLSETLSRHEQPPKDEEVSKAAPEKEKKKKWTSYTSTNRQKADLNFLIQAGSKVHSIA